MSRDFLAAIASLTIIAVGLWLLYLALPPAVSYLGEGWPFMAFVVVAFAIVFSLARAAEQAISPPENSDRDR